MTPPPMSVRCRADDHLVAVGAGVSDEQVTVLREYLVAGDALVVVTQLRAPPP